VLELHLILIVISTHYIVSELCMFTYAGTSIISHSWFKEELLRP